MHRQQHQRPRAAKQRVRLAWQILYLLGLGPWLVSSTAVEAKESLFINGVYEEEQGMETNTQIVIQKGPNNRKTITQDGDHLDLRLEQRGADNKSVITQQGSDNQAESIQEGDRNRSRIRQKGSDNRATIRQSGTSQNKKRETQ